ncbi:hypothetical protein E4U43_001029 [Claviceps pusilla]|uniref:RBR-type E3 ubiquitin transferase n=1 Tax=Claviceps pusilla TaxID=123648 RepID=A0A9P7SZM6_9HYPO|nr:hypothetical protein E4U43_001029 [Claviceps pusilla]
MDSAGHDDDDDPRLMELETLAAIFPEIRHSHRPSRPDARSRSEYTVQLELPVEPTRPVTVVFPAASSASNATHATHATHATRAGPTHDGRIGNGVAPTTSLTTRNVTPGPEPVDTLLVSHLPPLSLSITLPDGYPSEKAPRVSLTTVPPWLASTTLRALEDDGPRLWEEAGRDMVAFTYIDHLQREAENVFGTMSAEGVLEVNPEHKLAVLDFDMNAKRAAFEKETFECGICLDPKKGTKCHRMMDCHHVFCLQCLEDFYNDAITEGSISTVRCLMPNCAKQRALPSAGKAAKSKVFISPSELLQIGLTEDTVKRYVNLKYKTELEADKDTIYCPRQWCNGAARSTKHRKPQGLDFAESTALSFSTGQEMDNHGGDEDADADAVAEQTLQASKTNKKFDPADLLCICEDCGFAFCGRCLQTWHGEFVRCMPKRSQDELTEEEKASLEYLQLHTSPCPTCNAPAQKTHGCNHMICSRCDTHFCYLCSSWLDPANPYKHYNSQPNGKVTSCYMRLWELEGGDGDDVGLGFVGGRGAGGGGAGVHVDAADAAAAAVADAAAVVAGLRAELEAEELIRMVPDIEEPDTDEGNGEQEEAGPHRPHVPVNPDGNNAVEVAREAPLVLRVMDNQPRREPAPQPPPLQPLRGQVGGGRGRGRGRGQGQGVQGRGRAHVHGRGPEQGRRHDHGGDARAVGNNGNNDNRPRGGHHHQHHHNHPQAARRARAGGRGAGAGAGAPRHAVQNEAAADGHAGADALDAAQEAWVRRFVQMALLDVEDQVDGEESDSDDGDWRIR